MNHPGKLVEPQTGAVARYHAAKYRVFHRMHDDFLRYREAMKDA